MRQAVVCLLLLASSTAYADEDEKALANETIVFVRGDALIKCDGLGRHETELAKLPAGATVDSLRTDPGGKLLLAHLGTTWATLRLDGSSTSFVTLPCVDGPAQ